MIQCVVAAVAARRKFIERVDKGARDLCIDRFLDSGNRRAYRFRDSVSAKHLVYIVKGVLN